MIRPLYIFFKEVPNVYPYSSSVIIEVPELQVSILLGLCSYC